MVIGARGVYASSMRGQNFGSYPSKKSRTEGWNNDFLGGGGSNKKTTDGMSFKMNKLGKIKEKNVYDFLGGDA